MAPPSIAESNSAISIPPRHSASASSVSGNPFDSDVNEIATPALSERVETPRISSEADPATRTTARRPAPQPPVAQNEVQEKGPAGQRDDITPAELEDGPEPRRSAVINEKTETAPEAESKPKPGFFRRIYVGFRNIYSPLEEPPLVLPIAPNDTEKLDYIHMGRFVFFFFGILSFLALGAGMWLFTITAPFYTWYALFAGIICLYLLLSYGIGICGKDYDYKAHLDRIAAHPITEETAPTVDVFLPCCYEPLEILENTYKYIAKLDWPASKLKIYVMDDGAQDQVRALAEKYGFIYHVRDNRPHLRKAGNLRWNFTRTNGDYFIIFDADFCPRADFIKELVVEHLADEKTAIVQSPQWFRSTPEQTWVEQGAGATQELFYRVIQVNRDRFGGAICVGTNAMYRRAALEEVGGTADIGHSEDVHTGFGAIDRGWKVKFVPINLAAGICPDNPRAFFSQQMRWASGSTTLLTNPHFWTSKLTLVQKICYFSGFLFYVTLSLNIFINPLPGIFLLALRPDFVRVWNLAFAAPSFFYSLLVIPLWAKCSYSYNVQHVMTVQSFAYLTAIKDRVFNITAPWAVSGDAKAHKTNKYRDARIFCWVWMISVSGSTIGLVVWRILTHVLRWWDPLPLLIIIAYNLFKTHYFMFCNW
ncbi:family 2 glycosyl transferase [Thelonectria olida]|uniref:Family 2 glycosyl transferase n=1 Tax=Thelonectria olida TaxID=1576542 RepID=A0A9P8WF86_9HYPO|nr:family 2 glycosyl transferase [Thelonectria olida]